MEMTMRNYHEAVIALFKGEETKCDITQEDVIAKAVSELAKLDSANAKRKSTPSKTALANAPIKEAIVTLLKEKGAMVASEIGKALTTEEVEISTSKASAMCRQLTEAGTLIVSEIKIPKRGSVKQYAIAE